MGVYLVAWEEVDWAAIVRHFNIVVVANQET
jgi:hypothetical protein